jgi:hypothetical protein
MAPGVTHPAPVTCPNAQAFGDSAQAGTAHDRAARAAAML